jgi:hypothetical protein
MDYTGDGRFIVCKLCKTRYAAEEYSTQDLLLTPSNLKPAQDKLNKTATKRLVYESIGREIGKLVAEKQVAYGNSYGKSPSVLSILYPDGFKPDQYDDVLTIIRILDKLFRIATDKDALGEDPYRDIAGYAILAVERRDRDGDPPTT